MKNMLVQAVYWEVTDLLVCGGGAPGVRLCVSGCIWAAGWLVVWP